MNFMSKASNLGAAKPLRTPDVIMSLEVKQDDAWVIVAALTGTFNQARKMQCKLDQERAVRITCGIYSASELRIVERRRPRIKI